MLVICNTSVGEASARELASITATSSPEMGIYDAQAVVPKLDASGSNFWKWDAAITLYAQIHNALEVLTSKKPQPASPLYASLINEPKPLNSTTLDLNNNKHL